MGMDIVKLWITSGVLFMSYNIATFSKAEHFFSSVQLTQETVLKWQAAQL